MADSWQYKIDSLLISGEENLNLARNLIFNQKLVGYIAVSFLIILWIVGKPQNKFGLIL
jgi:hypothetical protein